MAEIPELISSAITCFQHHPFQAVEKLNWLSEHSPDFLFMLKEAVYNLPSIFMINDPNTHHKYQTTCQQLFSYINQKAVLHLRKENHSNSNYYVLIVQLLACNCINFIHKKKLQPALLLAFEVENKTHRDFIAYMQTILNFDIEVAPTIFIYLQIVLKSKMSDTQKLLLVTKSFITLFDICFDQLDRMVRSFRKSGNNIDLQDSLNPLSQILKQTQQILRTINNLIIFTGIYQNQNHKVDQSKILFGILFDFKLAQYISRLLFIQNQIFNIPLQQKQKIVPHFNHQPQHQKQSLTQIKILCLKIIRMILSKNQKNVEEIQQKTIVFTQFRYFSDLLIEELLQCSYPKTMSSISEDQSMMILISEMIGTLSQLVLFEVNQKHLENNRKNQLIALALGLSQTYDEEIRQLNNSPKAFFTQCFKEMVEQDSLKKPLMIAVETLTIKQNLVTLLHRSIKKLESFKKILNDLTHDILSIIVKQRYQGSSDASVCSSQITQQIELLFVNKYDLPSQLSQLANIQSSFFISTILIQYNQSSSLGAEDDSSLGELLEISDLDNFNQLELTRLYVFAVISSWKFQEAQFNLIQKTFAKLANQSSTNTISFLFLKKLMQQECYEGQTYCTLKYSILEASIKYLSVIQSLDLWQFLKDACHLKNIQKYHLNFSMIQIFLEEVSECSQNLCKRNKQSYPKVMTIILDSYLSVLKAGTVVLSKPELKDREDYIEILDQYGDLINASLTQNWFESFLHLLQKRINLTSQEYDCLLSLSDLLFYLLTHDTHLNQHSLYNIEQITLKLIERNDGCNLQTYEHSKFKLLYQLINRVDIRLYPQKANIILRWMSIKLQKNIIDEISINHVTIILQALFYYAEKYPSQIRNNKFSQIMEVLIDIFMVNRQSYQKDRERDNRSICVKNPVTVLRLYTTILINPYFNPRQFQILKERVSGLVGQLFPLYDLCLHVLAINSAIKKTNNNAFIANFKLCLQFLHFNYFTNEVKYSTKSKREVQELTNELKSQLTILQPFEQLNNMVQEWVMRKQRRELMNNFDPIQLITDDQNITPMIKNLAALRISNGQIRDISRVKRI